MAVGTASKGNSTVNSGQANTSGKNGTTAKTYGKTVKGGANAISKNKAQRAADKAHKNRFGGAQATGTLHKNASPVGKPKTAVPNIGDTRTSPGSIRMSAKPDNIEATDTAKEVLQDIAETVNLPKDGESNGS